MSNEFTNVADLRSVKTVYAKEWRPFSEDYALVQRQRVCSLIQHVNEKLYPKQDVNNPFAKYSVSLPSDFTLVKIQLQSHKDLLSAYTPCEDDGIESSPLIWGRLVVLNENKLHYLGCTVTLTPVVATSLYTTFSDNSKFHVSNCGFTTRVSAWYVDKELRGTNTTLIFNVKSYLIRMLRGLLAPLTVYGHVDNIETYKREARQFFSHVYCPSCLSVEIHKAVIETPSFPQGLLHYVCKCGNKWPLNIVPIREMFFTASLFINSDNSRYPCNDADLAEYLLDYPNKYELWMGDETIFGSEKWRSRVDCVLE